MASYIIELTTLAGPQFWAYGNPGRWTLAQTDARLYALRQSAENARVRILRTRPVLTPEAVTVREVDL